MFGLRARELLSTSTYTCISTYTHTYTYTCPGLEVEVEVEVAVRSASQELVYQVGPPSSDSLAQARDLPTQFASDLVDLQMFMIEHQL